MKRTAHICFVFLAVLMGLCSDAAIGQTNRVITPPPLPVLPAMKSPVDAFRTLLAMPAQERRAQLATRPAEVRKKLIAKLNEYQALSSGEQELRLRATELRWYLKPLMASSPTNRAAQLALIPESVREMVAERIAQWDRFPPVVQQMMLTNQAGPSYFVSGSPTNFPPSPSIKIRSNLQDRYNRLFELTPNEKEKVLVTLSEAERRQMEKTLESFAKLNPIQKRQCVISFTRFAGMSAAERQEFLKSAEHWSQMSASERQAWRELVSVAPKVPPLPSLTRRAPPMPPNPGKPAGAFSTNGG